MNLLRLPEWYEKLEVGMTFENCDDLADFLGITIRPGTNERQRLMKKVKQFFVVEYLPPKDPTRSKRSYAFKIVARKELDLKRMMIMISIEEYQQLRKDDEQWKN